jgi:hypothetical protein
MRQRRHFRGSSVELQEQLEDVLDRRTRPFSSADEQWIGDVGASLDFRPNENFPARTVLAKCKIFLRAGGTCGCGPSGGW